MIDNFDLADRHDRDQCTAEERAPKCAICGEPIYQTFAVCINGEYYCDDCLKSNREHIDTEH